MSWLNTRVGSPMASRVIKHNGREISCALEKLLSGQKDNSAGEDVAEFLDSKRMRSKVKWMEQLTNNTKRGDALSLLHVAESVFSRITNMLERLAGLNIQASSCNMTVFSWTTLNTEFRELTREIQRLARISDWNGVEIFQGMANDTISSAEKLPRLVNEISSGFQSLNMCKGKFN